MSLEPTSQETIAIACVVESSLALAAEWNRVLLEYISPLVRRLGEVHSGYKFQMAFVAYSTADSRPTPLLARRFFADIQIVIKEIREDPGKFGIGQSMSGGARGMAALEGLVAAVELFDTLRNCSRQPPSPARPTVYHLFHIAASPPDSAVHPFWNESTLLDSVTWQTLPSELRKRNINLSVINLRPLPQFPELQSLTSGGSIGAPWFPVYGSHSLFLTGFPASQKSVKRHPEAVAGDRTPESKRPKFSQPPTEALPAVANPPVHPPAQLPRPPLAGMTQSSLPSKPPPQPLQPPVARIHSQLSDRLRSVDMQLHGLEGQINLAVANGNISMADNLRREYSKQSLNRQKLNALLTNIAQNPQTFVAQQIQAQTQASGQGSDGGNSAPQTSQTSPSHANKEAVPPKFGPDALGAINTSFPGQAPASSSPKFAQSLHNRSASGSSLSSSAGQGIAGPSTQAPFGAQAPQMAQNVAAQMQKLIEQQQQQRGRPAQPGGMVPANSGQLGAEQGPVKQNSTTVWEGDLSWAGFDPATQGRKEVRAHVLANVPDISHIAECRSNTWPSTLTLQPAREPAVPMNDLQAWMKRNKPVICTLYAQTRVADPKGNHSHFVSLIELLINKKIYATASWTLPSGAQERNVLVFPINNMALVGAFFPVTGIPEMPKASPPPPVNMGGIPIPSEVIAQMQKLTPDQRNQFMVQFMRRQQQHRQQIQQQQHFPQQEAMTGGSGNGGGGLLPNLGHPNVTQNQSQNQNQNALMGLLGNQGGMGPSNNANNAVNSMNLATGPGRPQGFLAAGLPRPVGGVAPNGAGTGVGANVSYEMLQSFMQRNPEAGGSMGSGQ